MLPDSEKPRGRKKEETIAILNEIILLFCQFFKLWDYSSRTAGDQEGQLAIWNLFMSMGKIKVLKQKGNKPYHF